ncbi:Retinal-specific ATP-binding cassette transporter [Strongyloides ratti]|uniref:Retinal-specific ATP-binding cassette transporter n=1 Tax=Strongyloides ratti TaxID=34506 RepID=A0A090LLY3_STRRB|nr:Retinal-specific ATP-binding cassette transporter [Strongyloides ratti]CEF68575.1 Retinal-specific ATP-binding cassette transporter [Strongyloides ratti]
MNNILRHLLLLLKKIWIQRWRKKGFILLEFVLPISMFIILTIMRLFTQDYPKSHCHYDAKGLLSAGIQPMLDGILISYKNPCRISETSGGDTRYINTKILRSKLSLGGEYTLKFFKFIGEIDNFETLTQENLLQLYISKYKTDYDDNTSFLSKFKQNFNQSLYKKFNNSIKFKKKNKLSYHFNKIIKYKSLDNNNFGKSIMIDSELKRDFETLTNNIEDVFNVEKFMNERIHKTKTMERTICGGYKLPSFSGCKYYRYFDEITAKIKPLAAGYILITPKNNESQIIYDKISKGLFQLSDIIEYIKYFIVNKDLIKSVLNNSDINKIINILEKEEKNFYFLDIFEITNTISILKSYYNIHYPFLSFTDTIIDMIYENIFKELENIIPCLYFDRIQFVKNETEMENTALCLQKYNMFYTGIVLHDISVFNSTDLNTYNFTSLNNSIIYSLRPVNYLIDTGTKIFSRFHVRHLPRNDYTQDLKYFTSGFIYLQDIIDRILIEQKTKLPIPKFGIYTQQEPSPCVLYDTSFDINYSISLCIVSSFIFTFGLLVKNVVGEKESFIADIMFIRGLSEVLYYLAYFLDSIIVNSIISCLICLMLVYGKILMNINFWSLYIPMIFYVIATSSQIIIICSIFKNSYYALGISSFIYIVGFIPSALHAIGNFGFTYIYLIFPQSAIGSLLEIYINKYPGDISFFEYFDTLKLYTGLYYWHAYLMILIDVIFYTIFAFIIIPLLKTLEHTKFWTCIIQKINIFSKKIENDEINFSIIEDIPNDYISSVKIHNLVIRYPNGVYGLKGVSMNFYNNQITAFLGHNGAGKSTTVRFLSGMQKATSGYAIIYGKDSRYEMNEIRKMIGICPQENVLFYYLTVYEHFKFFGGLMNIPDDKLEYEINNILTDIGMIFKKDCLGYNLSGGMKRKLCMGLALLGGSKLIILDEPTSGVDPLQRRSIWDLIFKIKENRTIILSTHYMDEAEVLGDRILVMQSGKVGAEGSIKFLKEKLGNEILLKIRKECIEKCKDSKCQEYISKYCKLEKCSPLYMHYRIPQEQNNVISDLLSYLKKNIGMPCSDFQLYLSDFQDFFLKLSEKKSTFDLNLISNNINESSTSSESFNNISEFKHPEFKQEMNTFKLFWTRYFVLLKKRYYLFKNDFALEMTQRTLPLFTLILALLYSFVVEKSQVFENTKVVDVPLNIDISDGLNFYPLQSYISYNEYNEDYNIRSSNSTIKYLIKSPGLGNYCTVKRSDKNSTSLKYGDCDKFENYEKNAISTIIDKKTFPLSIVSNSTCRCGIKYWNCSSTNFYVKVATFKIQPNITLKDYSSVNISKVRLGQSDINGMIINGSSEEHQKYNLSKIHYSIDLLFKTLINNFAEEKVGKIWFNNRYYISSTAFLNSLSSAILRENYNKQGKMYNNSGVFTIKNPMVGLKSQADKDFENMLSSGVISLGILFSFTMMNAGNVKLLITERETLINELIRCSGTGRFVYWISYFTFDYFIFTIATFIIYNMKCFLGVTSVFFLFGLNYILSIYIIQHLYSDPAKGYIAIGLSSFFLGSFLQVLFIVLQKLATESNQFILVKNICLYIFALCPQFNINMTIYKTLMYTFIMKKLENSLNKEDNLLMNDMHIQPNLYSWDQLTIHIVILSITFFIRIILLLIVDNGFDCFPLLKILRKWYLKHVFAKTLFHEEYTHPTVLKEQNLVKTIDLNDNSSIYGVVCCNISKFYSYNKLAVKNISLSALKGECLGFLGTNGAGKSTTFYILTQIVYPDMGKTKSFGSYGYCPQIHSLNDGLTVKNNFKMYGLLRGISKESIDNVVEWVLQQMSLKDYADKLSKNLSGGNKRKLQAGIAIIGNPNIIYLDEPTSGMDPKSQTFLWNVIEKLREHKKTIIMCSHSMEECEVMCQKICIMVDGRIKIIGTMQSLKNELGYQYVLKIKAKEFSELTICNIIESHVTTASKLSIQYNLITYKLKYYQNIFEDLLSTIEKLSEQKLILDYNFRPVNLDDIFSVVADGFEARNI